MKRVLFVGFDPATVDFSDPALPPGMTAEKTHTGVELALADFAGRGWHPQNCFIKPDETAIPTIERFLAGDVYDCVVIGAGVRLHRGRLLKHPDWPVNGSKWRQGTRRRANGSGSTCVSRIQDSRVAFSRN